MDPLHWIGQLNLPGTQRCRLPRDLEEVLDVGEENPGGSDVPTADVERVWDAAQAIYATGVHPALSLCVRRRGVVVLNRAIGHARGNSPQDPPDAPKLSVSTETPFDIFSASKAITAMVIHKLDEQHVLHLEDRVCDFIPEFARHGKDRITLRHLLAHKAGIPNLPPDAMDLDLLGQPEKVVEIMCDAELQLAARARARLSRGVGRLRARRGGAARTGHDIRTVLERELIVRSATAGCATACARGPAAGRARRGDGPPVPWPISVILRNALGAEVEHVIELANDPRYLTGIVPSANIVTTASELCAFYQCLLDGGEQNGVRVLEPATIRHATGESAWWEVDFTLGLPIRYGLGFMLGNSAGPVRLRQRARVRHVGFSNIFSWADPERALSVALCTSGKPVLSLHAVRLVQWLIAIGRAFPKVQ
jgi:CubicO group peptidase (beta-lactamase class C family)